MVHPLIRPGHLEIHIVFFLSQLRCQNPYFELNTEQDAMRKLFLIKRGASIVSFLVPVYWIAIYPSGPGCLKVG